MDHHTLPDTTSHFHFQLLYYCAYRGYTLKLKTTRNFIVAIHICLCVYSICGAILLSANIGDTVTLHCSHEGKLALHFLWVKKTLGDGPQLTSMTIMLHSTMNSKATFTSQCSASRITTVVQQPVSESVQPGDSVTLNCTIRTETCAGEHSVYWFRHGSGESHPGIIYTHGDRSDWCEKSPEACPPTQSCVYNLPKRNLSLSDAGTDYCAVASCGEILFGNGTKLYIKDSLLLVYCLSSALGLSFILITVLGSIMYKMNKRTCLQCRDADSLHYVALNLSNKKNRSRRQRSNMEEETVYSGIRQ
uniref:Ig-like domain-containing protein n=1 Tax=Salmo trutta TaxID=8032 RepID=A0A674EDB5_SALTR